MSEPTTDTPELIYHYTNLAGLTGILKSGNIWCTNSLYLNDSRECRFTFDVAADYLLIEAFHSSEIQNDNLQKISQILKNFLHQDYDKNLAFPYIASFSGKKDLLSQWRGYCPDGGVSIGFKKEKLINEINSEYFNLTSTTYLKERHIPIDVKKVCDEFYENFKRDTNYLEYNDAKTVQHLSENLEAYEKEQLPKISSLLTSKLFQLSPKYKDLSFTEEDEYRIYTLSNINQKFRTNENRLVPYIECTLPQNCIKEIIVSPCSEEEFHLQKYSLEMFLDSVGLKDVEIKKSKIPYRSS